MAAVAMSMFSPNIPDDGCAHPCVWKGKTYYACYDGRVWARFDNRVGEWVGMIDLKRGIIDTSVPEPEYDDEDEEVQRWEEPPNGHCPVSPVSPVSQVQRWDAPPNG